MEDESVISLIQQGKHSNALDHLYKGFPTIEKFILKNGGSKEDAADLFQESLVIFCQNVLSGKFEYGASTINTYIFSICKYKWKDELKRLNKHIQADFDTPIDIEADLQEHLLLEQRFNTMEQVLHHIGTHCSKLLKLFYIEKKSMAEIADVMQYASIGSAKNQKYKCLEKAKSQASKLKPAH